MVSSFRYKKELLKHDSLDNVHQNKDAIIHGIFFLSFITDYTV